MSGLIPAHAGKTSKPRLSSASLKAHPRSRGENGFDRLAEAAGNGSSSLTRGKLEDSRPATRRQGLIPTHAGKTRRRSRGRSPTRAHPHSRGENDNARHNALLKAGSSPLTRGKPPRGSRASRTRWAHPHSRGENFMRSASQLSSLGSSPLTRGKLPRHAHACTVERLIPTHAGKTTTDASYPGRTWAHPHSRGENHPWHVKPVVVTGSSPLTRGKHLCCLLGLRRHGLIPTHAGKTAAA